MLYDGYIQLKNVLRAVSNMEIRDTCPIKWPVMNLVIRTRIALTTKVESVFIATHSHWSY